jgi:hypothetical protein
MGNGKWVDGTVRVFSVYHLLFPILYNYQFLPV